MFHHLTILNADGSENTAEEVVQDIGGPLCFQGTFRDPRTSVESRAPVHQSLFLKPYEILQVTTLQKKQNFPL